MTFLIAIIVLFIALIVFIVMCAKQTHWLNLVGASFVFLFAVFYLWMGGLVLKTNTAWKQVLESNQKKYEAQQAELEEALTGKPTDFEWPANSLKGLETAAAQQALGQGRVWRQCTPGAFTPGANPDDLTAGSLTITLPPNSPAFRAKPDPDAGAAGGAANGGEGTSLVYVFLEQPIPEEDGGGYKISSYIGSFFATEPSADNTTVKLSPSLILPDPANAAEIKSQNNSYRTSRELLLAAGNPDTRWAMYDILPVDSYDVFVDAIRAEAGDPKLEVTPDLLRQKLEEEYMPISMLRLQGNQEKYKKIIDSIVFTNQPKRVYEAAGFEPLSDELWYDIQFKEDLKNEKKFQVDFVSDAKGALEGPAFDRDGLALLETLRLGGDGSVVFKKDQSVLLNHLSWEKYPEEFLKQMKQDNTAAPSEIYYRRKLNDFDYDFRALVAFNEQITFDRNHAQAQVKQLEDINAVYDTQKATRTEEFNNLTKDVDSFKLDKAAIDQYRAKLDEQLANERNAIDRYFRLTKELAAKKAELEAKLSKLIEQKTREAEAAAGDAQ